MPDLAPRVPSGRSAWRTAGQVLIAFLLVEAVLLGLGLLVRVTLRSGGGARAELAVEHRLVALRHPWLDHLTHYGTVLGSTGVVIGLTVVGCLVLAYRGHGPRLPVFLLVAVLGETLLFLVAQQVLHRSRPPVFRLDPAAATSSFPSGHTAASVALWVGLALGLASTRPAHRLLTPIRVLAVALPAFVLFARLYRGMHWPSDVLASVLFVGLWLLLLRRILLPPTAEIMEDDRP